MHKYKRIGLVAHDACIKDLVEWVEHNARHLQKHSLVCTGTTGRLVSTALKKHLPNVQLDIKFLRSGPLGGDQQMGALIAEEKLDILIFLTDPMTTQAHDVDIKALTRLCAVYNIVLACTRATADFVITSPLFEEKYTAKKRDYSGYTSRDTSEML